jgi:hypothetical protein
LNSWSNFLPNKENRVSKYLNEWFKGFKFLFSLNILLKRSQEKKKKKKEKLFKITGNKVGIRLIIMILTRSCF